MVQAWVIMEPIGRCLRKVLGLLGSMVGTTPTSNKQPSRNSEDKSSTQSVTTADPAYRNSWTENLITFRVCGIPGGCSREQTSRILRELLLEVEDHENLEIQSLASSYDGLTQVATIRFDKIPEVLEGFPVRTEWHFTDSMFRSGESVITLDTHFLGLTILYTPNAPLEPVADLIAISGIGSHAFGSFKERGGQYMWLRDSLPTDFRRFRISVYGYQSRLDKELSARTVPEFSSKFLQHLTQLTMSKPNLPLIFVTHSFGGIVVKEALVQISRRPMDEQTNSILSNVLGILAFAVPSTGLDIESLLPIVRGGRNEAFLRSLEPGAEYLKDLNREWEALIQSRNIVIFAFYELLDSPTAKQLPDGQWRMAGPAAKLVRRESAVHGVKDSHITPINQNHSNVIKFEKRDETYNKVRDMLDTLTAKTSECEIVYK